MKKFIAQGSISLWEIAPKQVVIVQSWTVLAKDAQTAITHFIAQHDI
jgi:hypothetical protein